MICWEVEVKDFTTGSVKYTERFPNEKGATRFAESRAGEGFCHVYPVEVFDQVRIPTAKQGENMTPGMSEIINRFSGHKPDPETLLKMTTIRRYVRELGFAIEELCPNTREKATALTSLATVMMHANSAIVQSCPLDPSDV